MNPTVVFDRVDVSLSQPLLRGGGPAALWGLRGAKLNVSRAQLDWRARVEQAILDVSAAYWRLVSADRSWQLAIRSRQTAETSVEDAQERFDEGFAGSGDLLQVQRALGTARQAEVLAEAERIAANNALCRLLGRDVADPPTLVAVDEPDLPATLPTYDQVMTEARDRNALFLQARIDADQAELAVKGLRNRALPDLSVSGSFGVSGQDVDAAAARRATLTGDLNSWNVGASVSLPLLGRAQAADLRQARYDQRSAELAYEAAEQDLVLRVQSAVRSVQRDRLSVELATATLAFAEAALEADQERLTDGRGSTRDVVQSLEARDAAAAGQLQSQIALQRSLLELRRVAGTLVGPDDLPDPTP